MNKHLAYIYQIVDRYSGPLDQIANKTKKFKDRADKAGRAVAGFGDQVDRLSGLLGAAAVGAAMTKFIAQSVKMEDAMADIKRATGMTNAELSDFESMLERMSERLGRSKVGLGQMAYRGAKTGIRPEDMQEFLMLTAKTAISFDILDEEAGRVIGSIQDKMGLAGAEASRLLDSVNYIADTTSADGGRMIEVLERLSGTFKLLEFPPEIAAGFAGFADRIEVSPQLAASGLNMMMNRMRKMPGMTKKMMTDPYAAVNEQLAKMADMGPEVRTRFIAKVFGPEAGRFVEKAVANVEMFRETIEAATSEMAIGSMSRELKNYLERSSTGFKRLKFIVLNTMDTIGDAIKPFALAVADVAGKILVWVRGFAQAHPIIVRLSASIVVATAGVISMAVAASVLAVALAPITATVWGIIAAAAAITAAFAQWTASGNPVIDVLNELAAQFSYLLGDGVAIGSIFDLLTLAIEGLGFALVVALTPLRMVMRLLAGGKDVLAAIFSGDMKGAVDAIKSTGIGLADIGMSTAQTVMGQRDAVSKMNASGEIIVRPAAGAAIDRADINLNGGQQLATVTP